MKVIFIKDLKGQGKIGEIKEVKDGYGKNFLIKNKYAVLLTEKSLEKLEQDKKLKQEQEDENKKQAEQLKAQIEKLTLKFKVKVGDKNKIFGSISSKQICDELNKKNIKIDKHNLLLDKPLSSLGYYQVKIQLYKDIIADIKIQIIG